MPGTTYTFGDSVNQIYWDDIMYCKAELFVWKMILLIEYMEKEWGEIGLIDSIDMIGLEFKEEI